MSWFEAFLLTLLIEAPLVALVAPSGHRRQTSLDSVVANLTTHPVAWWCVLRAKLSWWGVEAAVLLVEAVVYRRLSGLSPGRALAASAVANGVTAALGRLL